jgi:glycosyltransferase involved in cell wall biosynthesis
MKILFVVNAPYLPDSVNGAVLVAHELAQLLVVRGEHVVVACQLSKRGLASIRLRAQRKLLPGRRGRPDLVNGYPTFRDWSVTEAIDHAVTQSRPDVAVILAGEMKPAWASLRQLRIPVICYHQSVVRLHDPTFVEMHDVGHIAVSRFVRDRLVDLHGCRAEVVHPFVLPAKYATRRSGSEVLFVNPIKAKGLDIALGLAALRPDLRFRFIRCWPTSDAEERELKARIRGLSNVRLFPLTRDMRPHYQAAALVVVPSIVEEAFGRVVLEAQVNGIPALVSSQGGLPEALGGGGLAVGSDEEIGAWVRALGAILDDADAYRRFSEAARAEGARREISPDFCCDQFFACLRKRIDPPLDSAKAAVWRSVSARRTA